MKSLLARLPCPRAIGAYVTPKGVAVSLVARTLFGPVELRRAEEKASPEDLPRTLARLLESFGHGKSGPHVVLGLPPEQVFFSTRPVRTDNTAASPAAFLREAIQSQSLSVDDMAADVAHGHPDQRKVVSIAACPNSRLAPMQDVLGGPGCRHVRVEPGPCAMLRAAQQDAPAPWRSRVAARVFLGEEQGLAVVAAARLPLVWRVFPLPAGEEQAAIRSVVRSLQAVLPQCGVTRAVDAVLIHGRPELRGPDAARSFEEPGVVARWHDGPGLSAGSVAYGLALGAGQAGLESLDLARTRKPAPGLLEGIPWKEAAMQAGAVAALAGYLLFQSSSLDADTEALQVGLRSSAGDLGTASEGSLRKERESLAQKVKAAQRFVATRPAWSAHTHEVAMRLPPGATLLSLSGISDMEDGAAKSKSSNRSLVLRASAPVTPGGTVPREVEAFLVSLRAAPALQRDFPVVELGDIRLRPGSGREQPTATFTVICLPHGEAKAKGG